MNRYAKLIVSQLNMTVLNHLPEAQRALDDAVPTLPNMSMSFPLRSLLQTI